MARGTALVTGASAGLGAEFARLCAADGYDVVLVARSAPRLAALAASLASTYSVKARPLVADLSSPAAPPEIFAQMSGTPVDLLINNAGFGVRGAYAETDWARESSLMQVNMVSLAHLTKLFLPEMLRRRSGRILNVASTAAFVPGPFMAVYYASKAFVLSFSEALSNEVEGTGVSVTVLCPGPTRTVDVARQAGAIERVDDEVGFVERESFAGANRPAPPKPCRLWRPTKPPASPTASYFTARRWEPRK